MAKNHSFFSCLVERSCGGSKKNVLYQLEIDMDPMYVQLPKGLRESLGHQGCLMACALGQYPSLHASGKIDNRFATNDISWFTSQVELVNHVGVVCLFVW